MAHIDEIFDYIKNQQNDIDAINRFIKLRWSLGLMPTPSTNALIETGIDLATSRATMILSIVEKYFNGETFKEGG